MELNLKRPIIFFDVESTGLDILNDRIIELSYIKVLPNGKEEEYTYRINPGMPIPAESSAIHHITDEDVANKPTFKQVAKKIAEAFEGCDIAGFNSNKFDVPILMEEFARAGVDYDFHKRRYVDVQTIFHKFEQRNLIAAYKFYCGKDLDNAHSANADTRATLEVLKGQLDMYAGKLENDIEKLAEFSTYNNNVDFAGRIIFNDKKQEIFNFGKYKGRLVEDIFRKDPAYYQWILEGSFAADIKKIVTKIKLRMGKD